MTMMRTSRTAFHTSGGAVVHSCVFFFGLLQCASTLRSSALLPERHVNPGVAAKAGEAVKRNKSKGIVRGVRDGVGGGGWEDVHRRARVDEVAGKCDMTESGNVQDSAGDRDRPHAQASVHDGKVE
jgi:hypothetical protein